MNRDLTAATKENLERLVILVPVMIVFLIIGLPLIYYVWRTFWTQAPGAGGHFTLAGFYDLQNPLVYDTLLNTVIYATVGTGIALFVGIWTAFLQRTDMRGRTVLKYIVIGQFLVPSFILAIGWSIVARPDGLINSAFIHAGIVEGSIINIYTVWGWALVTGLNMSGLVYLLVIAPVSSLPSTYEESALVFGASSQQIFREINIRLATPTILITAILIFAYFLQDFALPVMYGLRSSTYALSSLMYFAIRSGSPNYNFAMALGLVLLVLILMTVAIQKWLTRHAEKYETVTGSGGSVGSFQYTLGSKERVVATTISSVLSLLLLIPVVFLLIGSLQESLAFSLDSIVDSLTLDNYWTVFLGRESEPLFRAVGNTFYMAVLTASVTMVLAGVSSYIISESESVIANILDSLIIARTMVPSLIFGIAVLSIVLNYLTVIYGTIFPVVIGLTASALVFASRATHSSVRSIGDSLKDAGRVFGASPMSIVRSIYAPLMKPGLISAFVLAFVLAWRAFTIPVILGDAIGLVIQDLIWTRWSNGYGTQAAVISVLAILIMLATYAVILRVANLQMSSLRG